ncbi:hypothetical protein Ddc_05644 [Ditylenchus destructor]|nr:hypothetical protein Ddc_05644 [Ditylenchus destructor]
MYEVGEYFELIALTSFNFRIVLETESDVKIHVIEPTTVMADGQSLGGGASNNLGSQGRHNQQRTVSDPHLAVPSIGAKR